MVSDGVVLLPALGQFEAAVFSEDAVLVDRDRVSADIKGRQFQRMERLLPIHGVFVPGGIAAHPERPRLDLDEADLLDGRAPRLWGAPRNWT